MAEAKPRVNVDIVSDVICPWCWVGKRKMEEGMRQLDDKLEFHIRWLPHLLKPDTPPEGRPIPQPLRDPQRLLQIKQAGTEVGIEFSFSNTSFPNTLRAHALLELAYSKKGGAKQNDVAERLFKGYFTDGKMLTEDDVVVIGQEAGFDADKVRAYITDQKNLDAIYEAAMKRKGTEGVPLYYFNGQRMFSGAQNVEVFIRMLCTAAERFPVSQTSKT